jgi:hypothetical protein
MSTDKIGSSLMILFDELRDDEKSQEIIQDIDEADNDDQIKRGIRAGVLRLRELGKSALADDIEKKTKGFAF